jgi:flagellar hook-associated protein FlgK
VRLIEFQQAYAASARVIRSVDELFDILVTL